MTKFHFYILVALAFSILMHLDFGFARIVDFILFCVSIIFALVWAIKNQ